MTAVIPRTEKIEEILRLTEPMTLEQTKRKSTFEERLLKFLEKLEKMLTQRYRETQINWYIEMAEKEDRRPNLTAIKKEVDGFPPIYANVFTMKLHEGKNREVWQCVVLNREDPNLEQLDENQALAWKCREMAGMRYRIRKLCIPDENAPVIQRQELGVGIGGIHERPGKLENEWLARLGDSMALIAAGILGIRKRDELLKVATNEMLLEAAEILLTLTELKEAPSLIFTDTKGQTTEQPFLPLF